MDFFRKAADAVGGLILDSDSDSESERGESAAGRAGRRTAAEKNDKTPMDDHWTDGGMDIGADARASGSDDGAPPEGADGSFETSDDEGDEKLIPDAVWGALAAARGKISEVASTVRADVASAVEVVRHDLSEFNDRAVDETAAFAGDVAAAEYSAGLGLDANLGDGDDDDDTAGDDGPRLDPDVARAFDATVDALDDVGHRVEDFGVRVLGASRRFFKNLKEELALDDEDDDEDDDDGGGFRSRVGLGAGAAAAAAGGGLAAKFASDRASSKPRAGSSDLNSNPNPVRPKPQTLEQRVAAMQRDSATYCDEPEDLAGFERWTSGFDADSPTVVTEIESVLEGNAFMAELQARIVPLVVTREEFWQRYFYALRRIKLEFGVEKEEEDEKEEQKEEEKKEEDEGEKKKEEKEEEKKEKKKEEEKKEEEEEEKEGGKQIESANAEEAPEADVETAEPPAHPRVAAVSAADSAEESGVASDGSWTKVQSDGEVVEKETPTAEGRRRGEEGSGPAEKTGSEKEATTPPVAKEPAVADDDIDEDWGMDSD